VASWRKASKKRVMAVRGVDVGMLVGVLLVNNPPVAFLVPSPTRTMVAAAECVKSTLCRLFALGAPETRWPDLPFLFCIPCLKLV
jgi:hypothetical protein